MTTETAVAQPPETDPVEPPEQPPSRGSLRRTFAYLSTLALVFGLALGGVGRPAVLMAVVLHVVAATVWVRSQYADWLAARQWLIPVKSLLAAAVGVVVVAWLLRPSLTSLILAGAIVGYFAVGFLLVRARKRLRTKLYETPPGTPPGGRLRRGLWIRLAGAGALLLVGFFLLGRGEGLILKLSIAAAVVPLLLLLPPVTSLVSEAAVMDLSRPGAGPADLRRLAMVGGVGGAVVLAVVAWWRSETRWTFAALAVLFLLVMAVASATMADIAAVVGVVALIGVTPAPARLPAVLEPGGGEAVLVALGDSYMSGEGASIFFDGTDIGGDNTCHRAPTAWAAMLGQQGEPFDRMDFIACSGARTFNVRLEESEADPPSEPQDGEMLTQLDRYRANQENEAYTPKLVLLGIGGNDSGFATIGLTCLAPGDCSALRQRWMAGLDRVEQALRDTFKEVRDEFDDVPVVVPTYPRPIYMAEPGEAGRCDQVTLTRPELEFIGDFVAALNLRVARAAEAYDFHVVTDMQDALADAHLQLCDPLNEDRPGINFIGLRSVAGFADQRFNPANFGHNSLHPNERGHAAMLRTFNRWMPDDGVLPADAPAPDFDSITSGDQLTAAATTAAASGVECELYSDGPDGCKERGLAWSLREVGKWGLSLDGLIVAVFAASAWVFSVSFFAWRRAVQNGLS